MLHCSTHTFLGEVEQGDALPSCFSSHTINKFLFNGLFGAMFFAYLYLSFLVILLFKMTSKDNAEMLSNFPKRKKTVTYLTEKKCVLGQLYSGMS